MDTEQVIPLFPLNVVLFPHSKIPLNIFEERYIRMINENIEKAVQFGIILYDDRKINNTGCTADVEKILSKNEKGEMSIIVKGKSRFRLLEYDLSDEGFYKGKVKLLPENIGLTDTGKLDHCINIYNEIIEKVYRGFVKKIDLNDSEQKIEKRIFSFLMAEKSGMSLTERQLLLETDSENDRLDYILNYFSAIMPKIKEAGKISEIIKGNGYIQ